MSTALLRECVRGILLEAKKQSEAPRELVSLSAEDIMSGLEVNVGKDAYSKLHGVTVYTPYRVRPAMSSHPRRQRLAMLNPFEVASAAKYPDGVDAKKTQHKLKAEEGAAELAIDNMADRIAYHFEGQGIVAVTCVDSSHGMSSALADAVARKLGVPYQPIVKKTMDPNVSWDEGEWQKYQDKVRRTGLNGNDEPLTIDGGKPATPDEYLANTLKVMHKERDQARRLVARGEKPSLVRMMNMKTGHKSLFNLFDKIAAGDLKPGSKLLVVDDNVDSGWTPYHVSKRAAEAGLEPVFAAGFKMMRYYGKKA